MKSGVPAEFGIPIVAAFIFLVSQSSGRFSELALTAFIVIVTFLVFIMKDHKNEVLLFVIGILVGSFIEIGLRILGYQQVWTDASLFGVPYWLPIAWGLGFVLITRVGIHLRKMR
ncbi:MAG: hypothetical protein WC887_03045 [Candidatus Paceibacterota bacterium]|jgi:uncharacterized membrane protein